MGFEKSSEPNKPTLACGGGGVEGASMGESGYAQNIYLHMIITRPSKYQKLRGKVKIPITSCEFGGDCLK